MFSCGYGAVGLGKGTIETLELSPVHIDEKVIKVFATQDMAAAITGKAHLSVQIWSCSRVPDSVPLHAKDSGQLYTWGLGGHTGRLGLGHLEHAFVPQKVHFGEAPRKVVDLALGTSHALCLCSQ